MTPIKRLLMVTTVPLTLRSFLLPFAHHFRAKGWQVDAMAQGITEDAECLTHFDQVWDVKWSRNPLDPLNLLVAPPMIQDCVKREGYDLVHVHTPIAAFVTRLALRNLRKTGQPKVIYTAHGFHFYEGGNPLRNTIFLGLEKLAGPWTDELVVINREDQANAKFWNLLPPERIHYMPGIGVDLSHYHPEAIAPDAVAQVRQEFNIAPDAPMLLVLAEFTPRKRHADVLHAFAQLNHPTACLVLAGPPGPLTEEIGQLATQLGVAERVRFVGFRRDVPTLLRAATALVLASEHEGLPRSVMEALCLQTPVVGTDVRGTRDLLANGCGRLVELGDVAGLTQAIRWILDNPQDAQAMAQRGQRQMQSYDVSKVIRLTDELYAEALGDACAVDEWLHLSDEPDVTATVPS